MPALRTTGGGGGSGIYTAERQLEDLIYGGSDVPPPEYQEPGMGGYPSDSAGMYAAPVDEQYMVGGENYVAPYQAPATAPATTPATSPEATPAGWTPGVGQQQQGGLIANPAREFAAPATAPDSSMYASTTTAPASAPASYRQYQNDQRVADFQSSHGLAGNAPSGLRNTSDIMTLPAAPATAPGLLPQIVDAGQRFAGHLTQGSGSALAAGPGRRTGAVIDNPAREFAPSTRPRTGFDPRAVSPERRGDLPISFQRTGNAGNAPSGLRDSSDIMTLPAQSPATRPIDGLAPWLEEQAGNLIPNAADTFLGPYGHTNAGDSARTVQDVIGGAFLHEPYKPETVAGEAGREVGRMADERIDAAAEALVSGGRWGAGKAAQAARRGVRGGTTPGTTLPPSTSPSSQDSPRFLLPRRPPPRSASTGADEQGAPATAPASAEAWGGFPAWFKTNVIDANGGTAAAGSESYVPGATVPEGYRVPARGPITRASDDLVDFMNPTTPTMPSRPAFVLNPDGMAVPSERTSDAWAAGSGTVNAEFPELGAFYLDDDGNLALVPTLITETAYRAALARGDHPAALDGAEFDAIYAAGFINGPDGNPIPEADIPAWRAALVNEETPVRIMAPAAWTPYIKGAGADVTYEPVPGTAPGATSDVWVDSGTSGGGSSDWYSGSSNRGGSSRGGYGYSGDGGGGYSSGYGGGYGGGGYPSTMPADFMADFAFAGSGDEASGERPYPWNNSIFNRHFAVRNGGQTGTRSRGLRTRGRRGKPSMNRRSRGGSRMPMPTISGAAAVPPAGMSSSDAALAAALALRDRA